MSEHKVRIGGMHCASCVSKVEQALQSVPGVRQVQIQLLDGTGLLETDEAPRWEELSASLKPAGYSIEPFVQARENTSNRGDWESRLFPAAASLALGVLLMMNMHAYWLGLAVAVPVQLFWGRPFLVGVWRWIRGAGASMETLVGLGTTASLGLSISSHEHPYFEVGVFLIGFVRLGKWLEGRARTRTGQAVRHLIGLSPPLAIRMTAAGTEEKVPASSLQPGDRIRILAGERIPADGEIIAGQSSVNEAWLTGESLPVEKTIGARVLAGSQNGLGLLEVRVLAAGTQSLLSQIIDRVERAQMSRAPIQRVADQVASRFVPAVLILAALTALGWIWVGAPLSQAVLYAVAVLVIACPCALGLATPAALVVGLGRASQAHVLFKSGAALETLARARLFVFDKTGTLTEGKPSLSGIHVLDPSLGPSQWLALAASAEQGSEHILARALVAAARSQDLSLIPTDRFQVLPGQGIRASIAGKFVLIGTARFLAEQGIELNPNAHEWMESQARSGATCMALAHDFKAAALFAFKDTLRTESAGLIAWLKSQGLQIRMVSGDRTETALAIGRQLGLSAGQIEAEVLPHQKEASIALLDSQQGPVVMIGDGINDAPALARASVSVSLMGASEAAIDSAQVMLMSGKLADLESAIRISRLTARTIRQNLAVSAIYNVLGIPLAAGVLESSLGIGLSPTLAGAAMAASSVSVVANSLRLARK